MVLKFVGATGSTTVSYILPGLCYACLYKDRRHRYEIMPRSCRDHTEIMPRSCRDHDEIIPRSYRDHPLGSDPTAPSLNGCIREE